MTSRHKVLTVLLALLIVPGSPLSAQPQAVRAVDAASLRRQITQYDGDGERGSLDAMIATFADDVIIFAPGQLPVVGKSAARTYFETLLGQVVVKSAVHEVSDIADVGDAFVVYGRFRGTLVLKTGGTPLVTDSWFVRVYKRQKDGALLLWRGAFGDNAPTTPSSK